MSEEMNIDAVPRDPRALMSMNDKQRAALYKGLCEYADKKLPPGVRAFKKLDEIKQVQCLLNHLLDYDRATSGYRVEQVTLPVRTKRHDLNVRRMSQFSEEVEAMLNSMAYTGHQNAAQIRFEDHGVLFVGFKPPPPHHGVFLQQAGAPPPQQMPGFPSPFEGVPADAQETIRQHFCTELAKKLHALIHTKCKQSGKMTQDDVDEVVVENTKALGSEGLGNVLVGLEDLMNEHDKAHQQGDNDPSGCDVAAELKLLHVAVKQRLRMQLS